MKFKGLKGNSLYSQLIITISVLFIIAYFLSLFITQNIFLHFVDKQYRDRVYTLGRNLASVCYQPILNYNTTRIQQASSMFLQEEDVKYIIVLDREGKPITTEQKGESDPEFPEKIVRIIKNVTTYFDNAPKILKNSSEMTMVYPIKFSPNESAWGYVIMGFDTSRISGLLERAGYTALLISTFILFIGLLFLQRFSQRITRPIGDLMNGTEQVIQGNFEYQIKVEDDGEIGQLALKFNEMILKLNYYNKQKNLLNKKLHEYNEKLEEKIRERTQELKRIQEEVLLIFHQIPVGLLVVDLEGKILWYNQEFLHIAELDKDISIAHWRYMDVERIRKIGLSRILEKLSKSSEKQIVRKQLHFRDKHSSKIIEIASQPLLRYNSKLDGMIYIIKDITREVAQEKKNIQGQRLESVGTIAGGIAHDFNNILAIILPNAQLLKLKLQDSPDLVKYLDTIEQATEQAASLTQQILSFSRGSGKENVTVLNPNDVIQNFTQMFRRVLDRKIEIKQDLEANIWNIKADINQIKQVLMNLSVNARDAMPGGGVLTIRTRNTRITRSDKLLVDPSLRPGRYVLIEVEDTGEGIPEEHLDKIFDPFFTQKKGEKGTGLGLSIVYGIVRAYKGSIDVESAPGKGTRISLYLPTSVEKPKEEKKSDGELKKGSGQLLVADDEKMIQETLKRMLESLNYQVILADNGKEAVEIYETKKDEIDAILMDIQMPVMDGVEAAEKIYQFDANACIIFTSGYADLSRFERLKHIEHQYFLKKPYKIGVLSDIIKKAIEEKTVFN